MNHQRIMWSGKVDVDEERLVGWLGQQLDRRVGKLFADIRRQANATLRIQRSVVGLENPSAISGDRSTRPVDLRLVPFSAAASVQAIGL
jgi:hypothetical protein